MTIDRESVQTEGIIKKLVWLNFQMQMLKVSFRFSFQSQETIHLLRVQPAPELI